MTIKYPLFICSIFVLITVLISCPLQEQKTAVLCTDNPEFTSYVESFNTSQDEYRIIISYGEGPRKAIQENGKCESDLIIDSYLNSRQYLPRFASLGYLFEEETLEKNAFYPDLLGQGVYNDQQVLLPISFNLPALMFQTDFEPNEDTSYMLSLERLETLNTEFNTITEKGLTNLGLSVRWNPEMLYLITLLHGTGYRESETGTFLWNSEGLKESVDYIRNWTAELNGGIDTEREFDQKFMVEPPYNLISQGRILCYYRSLSDFYSLPPVKREKLKVFWPSVENRIPVLPDILFAGIPHGAQGIEAAKAFLIWFFQQQTQDELLKATQYKRLRTFGIAGGFSSLQRVNEQILPTYYPNLVGFIPSSDYLEFPRPLPPEWPLIQSEVLLPWLIEQADRETTTELMRERLEIWMRQRPPQ